MRLLSMFRGIRDPWDSKVFVVYGKHTPRAIINLVRSFSGTRGPGHHRKQTTPSKTKHHRLSEKKKRKSWIAQNKKRTERTTKPFRKIDRRFGGESEYGS